MASVVTAKFDFNAEGKGELGLKQGESLMVLKRDGEWLFGANSRGAEGWFPSNYTKEPAASPPAAGRAGGGFGGGGGGGGAGTNPFDDGAGGQGGEADDIASLIAQIDAATVSTPTVQTTTFSTASTSIAGDTEKGPADGGGEGGSVIAVAGETAEEAEAAEAARAKVKRKAGEKEKRLMKCVDEFLKTEKDYC